MILELLTYSCTNAKGLSAVKVNCKSNDSGFSGWQGPGTHDSIRNDGGSDASSAASGRTRRPVNCSLHCELGRRTALDHAVARVTRPWPSSPLEPRYLLASGPFPVLLVTSRDVRGHLHLFAKYSTHLYLGPAGGSRSGATVAVMS